MELTNFYQGLDVTWPNPSIARINISEGNKVGIVTGNIFSKLFHAVDETQIRQVLSAVQKDLSEADLSDWKGRDLWHTRIYKMRSLMEPSCQTEWKNLYTAFKRKEVLIKIQNRIVDTVGKIKRACAYLNKHCDVYNCYLEEALEKGVDSKPRFSHPSFDDATLKTIIMLYEQRVMQSLLYGGHNQLKPALDELRELIKETYYLQELEKAEMSNYFTLDLCEFEKMVLESGVESVMQGAESTISQFRALSSAGTSIIFEKNPRNTHAEFFKMDKVVRALELLTEVSGKLHYEYYRVSRFQKLAITSLKNFNTKDLRSEIDDIEKRAEHYDILKLDPKVIEEVLEYARVRILKINDSFHLSDKQVNGGNLIQEVISHIRRLLEKIDALKSSPDRKKLLEEIGPPDAYQAHRYGIKKGVVSPRFETHRFINEIIDLEQGIRHVVQVVANIKNDLGCLTGDIKSWVMNPNMWLHKRIKCLKDEWIQLNRIDTRKIESLETSTLLPGDITDSFLKFRADTGGAFISEYLSHLAKMMKEVEGDLAFLQKEMG